MKEGPSKRRPSSVGGFNVVGDNGDGVGGLPALVVGTLGVDGDGKGVVVVVVAGVGTVDGVVDVDAEVVTGVAGVVTVLLVTLASAIGA